ncbi:MAG: RDD family protein [Solirubrobacterales bacterium]|nr:RDD family protein [Solirubrobacterales bacterium]MBV9336656.1 RDD family protein [Solirubrobacterales bacterium]
MTDLAEPPTSVVIGRRPEPTERPAPVGPSPIDELRYIGLITRGIAFVIDAALISLVVFLVGAAVALIGSLFHFPHQLKDILAVIGGVAYVLWAAGYFIGFWSTTGQTPGDRVMHIRVVTEGGERIKPRRGIVRCVGLILATLPLFIGYLPILVDRRRRGFADWLAGTVVVDAPGISLAQASREKKRDAANASPAARD